MHELSVEKFYAEKRLTYRFELLTENAQSRRTITVREVNRPGLCLAGHTHNFLDDRIQILGETEITFLETMSDAAQRAALDLLFRFRLNCIVVTKSLAVPEYLVQRANACQVPVLRTPQSTTPFLHSLTEYLTDYFAPRDSMHASLADVYGVGILFVGRSGIGKSEIVLDLVERGHRLVADDVVEVVRKGEDIVMGRARKLLEHHMEIRGIGVVDVREIFGIRSIRIQKRIEVVIRLEEWRPDQFYDRHGLERMTTDVLGVPIPSVVVPIYPGKNITVLAEVVALDHMLRTYGYNAAANLQERILENAEARAHLEEYLSHDEE